MLFRSAFAGAIAYIPNGFDDYLSIKTAEVSHEEYWFGSTVHELPNVLLPALLLNQDSSVITAPVVEEMKITEAIESLTPGKAKLYDNSDYVVSIVGNESYVVGEQVTAYYRCGEGWRIVAGTSRETLVRYRLTTNWFGGLAIAEILHMEGYSLASTALVRDPLAVFAYQTRGDQGYAIYKRGEDKYYAIQAPCNSTPTPPEDVVGACCVGSYCIESTEAGCNDVGGAWQGPGTTCETTECGS